MSESYLDGICEAEKAGLIRYAGWRWWNPLGPQDDFSFLAAKGGVLHTCNSRHLDHQTAEILQISETLWGERRRQREKTRTLFLGPGGGVEMTDAEKLLPADGIVESVSLTPVNPYWNLRASHADIRDLMFECHDILVKAIRKHGRVSMEEIWRCKEQVPRLFRARAAEDPFPHLQHIGRFPKKVGPKAKVPMERGAYQYVLEDRGVSYYGGEAALQEAFRLVAQDGLMFVTSVGEGSVQAVRDIAQTGDIVVSMASGLTSCLAIKRDHPMAERLRAKGEGGRTTTQSFENYLDRIL